MDTQYHSKLTERIEKWSCSRTYDVCLTIGKLLNYNWLLHPYCCLKNYVADLEILTLELFTEMSKRIYFAPKTDEDVKQLFLKYRQLHKFVCEMAAEFCKENSVHHELSFVSSSSLYWTTESLLRLCSTFYHFCCLFINIGSNCWDLALLTIHWPPFLK